MSDKLIFSVIDGVIPPSQKKMANRTNKYDDVMVAIAGLRDGQHIELIQDDEASARKLGHAIRTQINRAGFKDLIVGQREHVLYVQKREVKPVAVTQDGTEKTE